LSLSGIDKLSEITLCTFTDVIFLGIDVFFAKGGFFGEFKLLIIGSYLFKTSGVLITETLAFWSIFFRF
jgi:hypothetical protein